MAHRIVAPDPIAYRDIHLASCRYRKQGLVCGTCSELAERAQRVVAAQPMKVAA